MNDPQYLEPLNKEAALQKRAEIDELLGQISAHEIRLARSYARLGSLIREVKVNQFWITYGYNRFTEYLEAIREKIGRERSQMYGYLSVAESLLPALTEGQLEDIGYSKAQELRRLVNQGGSLDAYVSTPILLDVAQGEFGSQRADVENLSLVRIKDYAADPKVTAKQLRVKINEVLHVTEYNQGLWFDLPGFYATSDERKEIADFWSLGKRTLELSTEIPEHEAHKQVFLAAIRECMGSWYGDKPHA
jgi:hypothetical protein